MRKLDRAAKELADFTFSVCTQSCKSIGSCCTDSACEVAFDMLTAIDNDNSGYVAPEDRPLVEMLKHVNHNVNLVGGSKSPRFLNADKVCMLLPYMRPNCTKHQCDINALGFIRSEIEGMPAKAATEKYFDLDDAFVNAVNEIVDK